MATEADYKIYLDRDLIEMPSFFEIKRGIYEIVNTNEDYDKKPSMVVIKTVDGEKEIPVEQYVWGIGWNGQQIFGQFVSSGFQEKFLDDVDSMSSKEIWKYLEGLRHSEFSVEEFIKEFGEGDEKKALKVAIRNDFDAMPLSQNKLDEIFIKAMSHHNKEQL